MFGLFPPPFSGGLFCRNPEAFVECRWFSSCKPRLYSIRVDTKPQTPRALFFFYPFSLVPFLSFLLQSSLGLESCSPPVIHPGFPPNINVYGQSTERPPHSSIFGRTIPFKINTFLWTVPPHLLSPSFFPPSFPVVPTAKPLFRSSSAVLGFCYRVFVTLMKTSVSMTHFLVFSFYPEPLSQSFLLSGQLRLVVVNCGPCYYT